MTAAHVPSLAGPCRREAGGGLRLPDRAAPAAVPPRRRRALPAVLLFACAGAQAQSSLTLSGIVDLALESGRYDKAVSATRLQSGALSPSRFSVRATEDLGHGVTAFAVLETLLGADSGAAGAAGVLWNRASLVGLRGKAGQVALGRQYAPMFWVALRSDASTIAFANASVMLNLVHATASGRSGIGGLFNNTVHYRTPDWHGWSAEASYALGNELSGARRRDGVNQGVNLQRAQGPWWVGAGYNRSTRRDAADRADQVQRTRMLAAKYSGTGWAVGVNAMQSSNMLGGPFAGGTRSLQVTAHAAAGPGDVNVGAGWLADDGGKRTRAVHAGYVLPLSRRTQLYGYGVKLGNNAVASRGLANLHADYRAVAPGFSPRALVLGIRHQF